MASSLPHSEIMAMGTIVKHSEEELLKLLKIGVNEQLDLQSLPTLIFKLSECISNPEWTEIIADTFPYLLPILFSLLAVANRTDFRKTFICLAKLVGRHPSLHRCTAQILEEVGSLNKYFDTRMQPSAKLSKRPRNSIEFEAKEFLLSAFLLKKCLPNYPSLSVDLSLCFQLLKNNDLNIRWLGANYITDALGLPETKLKLKNKSYISAEQDSLISKQMQDLVEHFKKSNLTNSNVKLFLPRSEILNLSLKDEKLLSLGGVIIQSPTAKAITTESSHPPHVCSLPLTIDVIRDIALATLSQTAPICLSGPVGSGKTLLLQYTMCIFGRSQYPFSISIQMSDQIDSKLLLGSCHTTDLPGQFIWKQGCLTKAVLNGYWIIFEDLDAAPADVLTLLSSLVDNGKLSVPGYGEIQSVHPDFRMFATCRTQVGKRNDKLKSTWTKVNISQVTGDELKCLIIELFPHLKLVSDRLISMYNAIIEFSLESTSGGRLITLRDFIKFCGRIPPKFDFNLPESAIFLFQEALDLFGCSWKSQGKKQEIAEIIGTHLNLLNAKVEYFCTTYKPNLNISFNTSSVTCGRHSVKLIQLLPAVNRNETPVYSLTKRASCLVEMICGCIKSQESVLITGETGVGKTSCVQYLANILQQQLIVVNLNRQSDSADLLGGPVELKYIFGPIREQFENLFLQTFSKDANSKFLSHIMTCFANRRWKDLIKLMLHVEKAAFERVSGNNLLLEQWTALSNQISRVRLQLEKGESPFAFTFIEGSIIKAIKDSEPMIQVAINSQL